MEEAFGRGGSLFTFALFAHLAAGRVTGSASERATARDDRREAVTRVATRLSRLARGCLWWTGWVGEHSFEGSVPYESAITQLTLWAMIVWDEAHRTAPKTVPTEVRFVAATTAISSRWCHFTG